MLPPGGVSGGVSPGVSRVTVLLSSLVVGRRGVRARVSRRVSQGQGNFPSLWMVGRRELVEELVKVTALLSSLRGREEGS